MKKRHLVISEILVIILFTLLNKIIAFNMNYMYRHTTLLEAKVGSYAEFNCPLEFPNVEPIPYIIHWLKDESIIFEWFDGVFTPSYLYIGRIHLLDNSYGFGKASINLTSIRETDSGWYECRVLFPNRTPSMRHNGTLFHLAVEGGSLIKIPPTNQTILEGEPALLHCSTKHPSTSLVSWRKDGIPLQEMIDLTHRSTIEPDGSLNIFATLMTDIGEYICVVRNVDDEEQVAKAFLNIQYKAKVIYAPTEVYLPYGQPAVLDCHFRSNPPLTNLRWEKDGFLYDPYNVQGVFYKRNGSLYFSSVDDNHAGHYTCTPYNELGTQGQSPPILVVIQRPPSFSLKPKPLYVTRLHEKLQMECNISESSWTHNAVIEWRRKDGNPLPFNRVSFNGSNITIENINETDRGIYQCIASNEAATIIADTELMIENVPPNPPYNLTANSTDKEITLRWEPGYIRPYLEYIVWYRLIHTAEWRTMKILARNKMQATITNLEPGQQYEFMVLTQDRYGDGIFSKAFKYYTKPQNFYNQQYILSGEPIRQFAEIGAPKNLTIREIPNSYSYNISWSPPDYDVDLLKLYILRWHREPGHILSGTVETREQFHIVEYLNEDVIYVFQVFSLSNTDFQAGSAETEFLVPPYRKMRAIAFGVTIGLVVILIAVAIYIYRMKYFKKLKENNVKI